MTSIIAVLRVGVSREIFGLAAFALRLAMSIRAPRVNFVFMLSSGFMP
jgi:hypothetical protein